MTNKTKGQIRRGMSSLRSNVVFDRPDGTVYVQFNWRTESFEFGTAANAGMIVDYVVPYDADESFERNLSRAVLMAEDFLG